jgi:PAS domain S-box-containing protein
MNTRSLQSKSEAQYKNYVETMEDWLWECDPKGKILFSSPSVKKLLGFTASEVVGKNIFSLMMPDDHEGVLLQFSEKNPLPRSNLPLVTRFYSKDGALMWFDSKVSILTNKSGKRTGYRVVSRDLTEMKKLEALRMEVTSVINHEIRTPLTTIYGALALLSQGKMDPSEAKEFIDVAFKNSVRLKELVEKLLDIRDSEAGLLRYDFEVLNINDVVKETVELFQSSQIKVSLSRGVVPAVRADKERLKIVLSNLLTNAIRASSPKGLIWVRVQKNGGRVRVSVEDKGEGIPTVYHPIIFEKFVQAGKVLTRKKEGAGLGLNLCRHIIEGHGGFIDFVSKEKEGSTFYFEIPLHKSL